VIANGQADALLGGDGVTGFQPYSILGLVIGAVLLLFVVNMRHAGMAI
jgi:uncharacterized membrane protein YeaQ/YmgE (transglycosylase-associated protein family)